MLFVIGNGLENKDTKEIEEMTNQINEAIGETEDTNVEVQIEEEISLETNNEQSTYVSSYYKDYNNVYVELLKINPDTIGWIKVNNTKINYPVVQSSDNDYYLNHAYDKTKNIAGWIYVDYRNNMDTINKNTIIYGHSGLKGNLMFTSLNKVLNKNWYSDINNRNISFSIKGREYVWKIFSIYTIKTTSDYLYIDFESDEKYIEFINMIKNRSITNFNEEVTETDKILTLSTCYNGDKSRLVVHAKLIK